MSTGRVEYEDPDARAFRIGRRILTFLLPGMIVLILLLGSCYTVEQGERVVVTRFGAVIDVTNPGVHLKLPLIDRRTTIDVRTRWIEWKEWRPDEKTVQDSRMESYSQDQQPAHLGVKITYHVKPDAKSVVDLFSQYRDEEGYAANVLTPRAYEAVKVSFGQFTAISAVQDREKFIAQVNETYRRLVGEGPVLIEGVQIQDIKFSPGYEHAIEERMRAEVEVTKVRQNLEKEKLTAQMAVVKAEGDAKAVRLRGEAEAAAIKARSDALRDSPKLVELTAAEKWDGKLPTTMVPNAALPLLGGFTR